MLCLACNYSLNDLPIACCPECGRHFDPGDPTTFNAARPLNWLDRRLLAPIGPITFGATMVPCVAMLYLSLGTDIYYMGIYLVLLGLLCCVVVAVAGSRLWLRAFIPPAAVPRPGDRRRVVAIGVAMGVTCVLVVAQVPLRVAFMCSRPQLDRLVADIGAGKVTEPIPTQRAGLFVVESASAYGGDDTLFFTYLILGQRGGFAHCPTEGPGGYYNTGTDGSLGGHWHWWTDD